MKNYELVVVLPETATAATKKTAEENIKKLISAHSGKVTNVEDWGKKDLVYEIKKNNAGVFVIFTLELEPKNIKELDNKLRLEDTFIRYLLIAK